MPLLNYTTTVPTEKTVMEVMRLLAAHGATATLAEYDAQGLIVALSFRVAPRGPGPGAVLSFRLPVQWQPVLRLLERDRKVPRRLATKEQALRVSWRIIKDWVEAQMALIATQMVSLEQVFLPYALAADGRTMYEHVQAGQYLPLNPPTPP
jgi:hypothetical protein